MNIIVLDNSEKILTFLNPDLVDVVETFEEGLRSIDVSYNIEELLDAQKWFVSGHKIFITGGQPRLTDCLYVLNSEIQQDLFDENRFSFTAEEVLVELNYAPFFTQTELKNAAFTTSQIRGETAVTVNWNSLNYWFGDYFNVGIVQDCLSAYLSKITFNGSMSLMNLLRYIEEETGNVFVTRYEKDVLSNTIHRYLDFLNPVSQNKNWKTYFEYDFIPSIGHCIIDDSGNPVDDDDDPLDDDITAPVHVDEPNIDLSSIRFRLTKDGTVIVADNGTHLEWTAADIGLTAARTNVAIQIKHTVNQVGIKIHDKSFTYPEEETAIGGKTHSYLATIGDDPTLINDTVLLPNDTHFEFYDNSTGKVLYSRTLNPILSQAREEVLDLGYNVENIQFSSDESDTFTAISPVLKLSDSGSGSNGLSTADMGKIVTNWRNLEVTKGDIIPMIVERVTITGTDDHKCVQRTGTARDPNQSAEQILGTYTLYDNYYTRPLKPNDNTESDNKSYEYWKGTAYWKAPFNKKKGSFHIQLDTHEGIDYEYIRPRTDLRNGRSIGETPKMGQVETSDENKYAIYNAVAMKLKDKKTPKFIVDVDVANYRDGLLNDYQIHDRVYVKLPGQEGLVTAKVVKTVKSLHDLSENKVTLDNYSINTKDITTDTYIEADNISFKYPKSKKLTVSLKNLTTEDDKLSNKLVTFTLYNNDNGSSTLNGKVYTKKTNSKGQCSINCKYDPGDYEMVIQFGGDAEYTECSTTVLINVSGVKKTKNTNADTKTTAKKYKNVKRFWSKYGESPDKKYVKAIGRASAPGELGKYGYSFYEAEFKNVCPKCGKKGTLFWDIFWAGDEHTDYGYIRKTKNWEGSSAEGTITCSNPHCDGDWSIFGKEHGYSNTKLTVHKKVKKSSKKRAYELRNGKMYYDTVKKEVKSKKVVNKTTRKIKGNISSTIKKLALQIVGNSIGRSALLKICAWMDKKIHYTRYCGFCRSPEKVVQTKHCNCCDGTRLFLQLCDAAGLTEYYDLYYVQVPGHVYAQVRTKSTGHRVYIDTASDSHSCYAYVCQTFVKGSPSSTYPNQPFYGACTSC
jgi:hypothetical protein